MIKFINFGRYREIYGLLRLLKDTNPLIADVRLYVRNINGDLFISNNNGLGYLSSETEIDTLTKLLNNKIRY